MQIEINERTYELQTCRGFEGKCSFSLVKDTELTERIQNLIDNISSPQADISKKPYCSSHKRIKIALAACPNACTMPQIKDFSINARLFPNEVTTDCNGCANCESACREQAISVTNNKAKISEEHCLGCGMCIKACPSSAITHQEPVFKILIGGRMGRHPKWAEEICTVHADKVCDTLNSFINKVVPELSPGERISELVNRLSLEKINGIIS